MVDTLKNLTGRIEIVVSLCVSVRLVLGFRVWEDVTGIIGNERERCWNGDSLLLTL